MASASDHRAHAALQPADCLILLPQRLPAAVETSIVPAHYPAECTQSDAFLQPSLRARNGRANSNSLWRPSWALRGPYFAGTTAPVGRAGAVAKLAGSSPVKLSRKATMSRVPRLPAALRQDRRAQRRRDRDRPRQPTGDGGGGEADRRTPLRRIGTQAG